MLPLSIVTTPTENGQRRKGHPVTREDPRQTEAVSDRGNATMQKSAAATPEEHVAEEKATLAASKEARKNSHNVAIEMVKFNESKFLSSES